MTKKRQSYRKGRKWEALLRLRGICFPRLLLPFGAAEVLAIYKVLRPSAVRLCHSSPRSYTSTGLPHTNCLPSNSGRHSGGETVQGGSQMGWGGVGLVLNRPWVIGIAG